MSLFCLPSFVWIKTPLFLKWINYSISHGTLLRGLYCKQSSACSICWQRPAIGIVLWGEHCPLKAAAPHLANLGRVSFWKHFQKEGKSSGNITDFLKTPWITWDHRQFHKNRSTEQNVLVTTYQSNNWILLAKKNPTCVIWEKNWSSAR